VLRPRCALHATGGVSCWGENASGQLGNGSTLNQLNAVTVPSFTVNIDPQITLEPNGRVTTVTVVANCEVGQQLQVDVSLIQGEVSGRGSRAGQCTGGLARFPVMVAAQGSSPFAAGPAQVKAEALIRDSGLSVETQEWTRQVNIASVP
jgi:regulator of chromosome condensation (RCC1) repeat-containing protein